jgi:MFS family permease
MSKAKRVEDVRESVLIDQPPSPFADHRPPLFTRDFILLCLVTLGYFFSFFFFFPTLPFYIKHLGGREADVGLLIGISSLVSFSVKPLAGRWADRHGRVPVMTAAAGLFACGAVLHVWALRLGFAFAPNGVALYLGVSLYGLGIGLAQPGLSAFVIDHLTPERRGLGMSTFGQGTDLGMGLGGVLMGRIATQVGFTAMYLCGSGCVGAALAIFLWGNRAERRCSPLEPQERQRHLPQCGADYNGTENHALSAVKKRLRLLRLLIPFCQHLALLQHRVVPVRGFGKKRIGEGITRVNQHVFLRIVLLLRTTAGDTHKPHQQKYPHSLRSCHPAPHPPPPACPAK